MINKYAEINNRLLLFKAASGICRVKLAEEAKSDKPKEEGFPKANLMDKIRLKYNQGRSLASGYNGPMSLYIDDNNRIKSKHSWKSRGRQALAIGLQSAGSLGGAFGGYELSKAVADKLGLSDDEYDKYGRKKKKSLLKRLAKAGLITAGTVGGGLAGYGLSAAGSGFLNGLPWGNKGVDAISDVAAVMTRPKVRKEMLNSIRETAKKEKWDKRRLNDEINGYLNITTPIAKW